LFKTGGKKKMSKRLPGESEKEQWKELFDHVAKLYQKTQEWEIRYLSKINSIPKKYQESAKNLIHYLAVRDEDLRSLQWELARCGLSSLGRIEANVQVTLESVLKTLGHLLGNGFRVCFQKDHFFDHGPEQLKRNTNELLGEGQDNFGFHIMATIPTDMAKSQCLADEFVNSGMSLARINCAHDSPTEWKKMIKHIKNAARSKAKECKIQMDIPGPKLRTGSMTQGPRILTWRPQKNHLGEVICPARVLIVPDCEQKIDPRQPTIRVAQHFFKQICEGDSLKFTDRRNKDRYLNVVETVGDYAIAEGHNRAWIEEGSQVLLLKKGQVVAWDTVTGLKKAQFFLTLYKGEKFWLTNPGVPGVPEVRDNTGKILKIGNIPVSIKNFANMVPKNTLIYLDDGMIRGKVVKKTEDALLVEVIQTSKSWQKLKSNKGINLPEHSLPIKTLSEKDFQALDFAWENADLVGLSFIQSVADIKMVQNYLASQRPVREKPLGIVLKIETDKAFQNLPHILLQAIKTPPVGVMVARGDLAVEVGFERLAEVQEEILWMSEAMRVPVIWATQVLENLAKRGLPTRAEITDAANSVRAECVMINKGPYVPDALRTLQNILNRMQGHQNKKRNMLRKLNLATHFKKHPGFQGSQKTENGGHKFLENLPASHTNAEGFSPFSEPLEKYWQRWENGFEAIWADKAISTTVKIIPLWRKNLGFSRKKTRAVHKNNLLEFYGGKVKSNENIIKGTVRELFEEESSGILAKAFLEGVKEKRDLWLKEILVGRKQHIIYILPMGDLEAKQINESHQTDESYQCEWYLEERVTGQTPLWSELTRKTQKIINNISP